ncbi:MAG: 2Fe-2S iron-sulfur cluster-binding protein [Desulfobacterales bacterium]|nr:2Fe-2S iron-sulfur cluster-binding protein [Desulfobacterales bacterium]
MAAPIPYPIQQAWIEEQAVQCGYCTSGHIMTAKALLDKNPHPTEALIRSYSGFGTSRISGKSHFSRRWPKLRAGRPGPRPDRAYAPGAAVW